jgi:hypothetical protein
MEENNELENQDNNLLSIEAQKTQNNLKRISIFNLILLICLIFILIGFTSSSFLEKDNIKKSKRELKANKYLNEIIGIYSINNIDSKEKIINMPYDKLNIKLFINDIEKNFTTEYQFEEKG